MREILFRGKTKDGDWLYGSYVRTRHYANGSELHKIIRYNVNYNDTREDVDGNTIGQFTGLHDKNESKIFEGDILLVEPLGYNERDAKEYRDDYSVKKYLAIVEWILHPTRVEHIGNVGGFREYRCTPFNHSYQSVEIIGNIHDNPELLK